MTNILITSFLLFHTNITPNDACIQNEGWAQSYCWSAKLTYMGPSGVYQMQSFYNTWTTLNQNPSNALVNTQTYYTNITGTSQIVFPFPPHDHQLFRPIKVQ